MKVKRYVVDSMPDAMQKIRTELGKDAVIINTKEIRVGGVLGFFAKKKIEVIAATDGSPDSGAPAASGARRNPAPPSPPPPALPVNTIATARSAPSITAVSTESAVPPVATVSAAAAPSKRAEAGVHQLGAFLSAQKNSVREDALLEEMRQMKEMMRKLAAGELGSDRIAEDALTEPFLSLKQHLLDQEVRVDVADALLEGAEKAAEAEMGSEAGRDDVPQPPTLTVDRARQLLKAELLSVLQRRPVEPLRLDTRIVHFVGPTGVGKTTTIAKLAAEQVLKHKRSVGFITSDTYRIAAVEQLKTYANILNIPLEVVFSPLDLPKAFEKLADRDVIFMDTAGRNFRNEMYVSELNSLLRTQDRYETYLVLSLSMKYNDMSAITHNFSKFGLDKVLFTKADETVTFGSVINLLYDFDLSLSYLTDGQNVPDDIRPMDVDKLADWLLEGAGNE